MEALSLLKSERYSLDDVTRKLDTPIGNKKGPHSLLDLAIEWEFEDVVTFILDMDTTGTFDHAYAALTFAIKSFGSDENREILQALLNRLQTAFLNNDSKLLDTQDAQVKVDALDAAMDKGLVDVFNTIMSWGVELNTPAGSQILVEAIKGTRLSRYFLGQVMPEEMNRAKKAILMAERLLEAGATIPETANPSALLIHFIESENDSGAITRALLQGGASPDITAKANVLGRQEHILLLTTKAKYKENVEALIQYSQKNKLDLPLRDALTAALKRTTSRDPYTDREKEIILFLLKNGAPVNYQDDHGDTPLHMAVSGDIAKALIQAGADINEVNNSGQSPLFPAIFWKLTGTFDVLICAGADVDKASKNGMTPLLYAARGGDDDTHFVTSLVRVGAERFKADKNGRTPYAEMREKYKPEILAQILKEAPDIPLKFTLKQQCRITIKKFTKHNWPTAVQALPIPNRLQNYLICEEETDEDTAGDEMEHENNQ